MSSRTHVVSASSRHADAAVARTLHHVNADEHDGPQPNLHDPKPEPRTPRQDTSTRLMSGIRTLGSCTPRIRYGNNNKYNSNSRYNGYASSLRYHYQKTTPPPRSEDRQDPQQRYRVGTEERDPHEAKDPHRRVQRRHSSTPPQHSMNVSLSAGWQQVESWAQADDTRGLNATHDDGGTASANTLTDVTPAAPTTADWAGLQVALRGRVHGTVVVTLDLSSFRLTASQWGWLCTDILPQLCSLEALILSRMGLTDAEVRVLLIGCHVTPTTASTAGASNGQMGGGRGATPGQLRTVAPRLRTLDLSSNALTFRSATYVGKLILWSSDTIDTVRLQSNPLKDHGFQVLGVYLTKLNGATLRQEPHLFPVPLVRDSYRRRQASRSGRSSRSSSCEDSAPPTHRGTFFSMKTTAADAEDSVRIGPCLLDTRHCGASCRGISELLAGASRAQRLRTVLLSHNVPSSSGGAAASSETGATAATRLSATTSGELLSRPAFSDFQPLQHPCSLAEVALNGVPISQLCAPVGCRELLLNILFCCPQLRRLSLAATCELALVSRDALRAVVHDTRTDAEGEQPLPESESLRLLQEEEGEMGLVMRDVSLGGQCRVGDLVAELLSHAAYNALVHRRAVPPAFSGLQDLSLRRTALTDQGSRAIWIAMRESTQTGILQSLRTFDLSENLMTAAGCAALVEAFYPPGSSASCSLSTLLLQRNAGIESTSGAAWKKLEAAVRAALSQCSRGCGGTGLPLTIVYGLVEGPEAYATCDLMGSCRYESAAPLESLTSRSTMAAESRRCRTAKLSVSPFPAATAIPKQQRQEAPPQQRWTASASVFAPLDNPQRSPAPFTALDVSAIDVPRWRRDRGVTPTGMSNLRPLLKAMVAEPTTTRSLFHSHWSAAPKMAMTTATTTAATTKAGGAAWPEERPSPTPDGSPPAPCSSLFPLSPPSRGGAQPPPVLSVTSGTPDAGPLRTPLGHPAPDTGGSLSGPPLPQTINKYNAVAENAISPPPRYDEGLLDSRRFPSEERMGSSLTAAAAGVPSSVSAAVSGGSPLLAPSSNEVTSPLLENRRNASPLTTRTSPLSRPDVVHSSPRSCSPKPPRHGDFQDDPSSRPQGQPGAEVEASSGWVSSPISFDDQPHDIPGSTLPTIEEAEVDEGSPSNHDRRDGHRSNRILPRMRTFTLTYTHPPGHLLCRMMHLLQLEGPEGDAIRSAVEADMASCLQPTADSGDSPQVAIPAAPAAAVVSLLPVDGSGAVRLSITANERRVVLAERLHQHLSASPEALMLPYSVEQLEQRSVGPPWDAIEHVRRLASSSPAAQGILDSDYEGSPELAVHAHHSPSATAWLLHRLEAAVETSGAGFAAAGGIEAMSQLDVNASNGVPEDPVHGSTSLRGRGHGGQAPPKQPRGSAARDRPSSVLSPDLSSHTTSNLQSTLSNPCAPDLNPSVHRHTLNYAHAEGGAICRAWRFLHSGGEAAEAARGCLEEDFGALLRHPSGTVDLPMVSVRVSAEEGVVSSLLKLQVITTERRSAVASRLQQSSTVLSGHRTASKSLRADASLFPGLTAFLEEHPEADTVRCLDSAGAYCPESTKQVHRLTQSYRSLAAAVHYHHGTPQALARWLGLASLDALHACANPTSQLIEDPLPSEGHRRSPKQPPYPAACESINGSRSSSSPVLVTDETRGDAHDSTTGPVRSWTPPTPHTTAPLDHVVEAEPVPDEPEPVKHAPSIQVSASTRASSPHASGLMKMLSGAAVSSLHLPPHGDGGGGGLGDGLDLQEDVLMISMDGISGSSSGVPWGPRPAEEAAGLSEIPKHRRRRADADQPPHDPQQPVEASPAHRSLTEWDRLLESKHRRLMRVAVEGMARGNIPLDPQSRQTQKVAKGKWGTHHVVITLEWEILLVLYFERPRALGKSRRAQMLVHPVACGFSCFPGEEPSLASCRSRDGRSRSPPRLLLSIHRPYSCEELGVSVPALQQRLAEGLRFAGRKEKSQSIKASDNTSEPSGLQLVTVNELLEQDMTLDITLSSQGHLDTALRLLYEGAQRATQAIHKSMTAANVKGGPGPVAVGGPSLPTRPTIP